MSVNYLLKRSATPSKRPDGSAMTYGELLLNYDASTGGLYYKDSDDFVVKVGPCQVSATAPNSSPGGSVGNSAGEFWYDTTTNTLKVFDGSVWQETGGAVQGITGTEPIDVDNTDPLNPVIGILAASTSNPGAVQLNDTVTSTSISEAATANAVKTAYDLASSGMPVTGGTFTGNVTFDPGTQLLVDVGSNFLMDGSASISGTTNFEGSSATNFLLGSAVSFESSFSVGGDGSSYTLPSIDGTAGQILTTNGSGTASWADNAAVLSVTGSAPVSVDNTNPQEPIISVDASTTTTSGIVQLEDSCSSTSDTLALTANQGYLLQQQINALLVSTNLTYAGTIDASTGNMVTVSSAGTAKGFTVGNPLPSPVTQNKDFFVIVSVAGTMTPPGGSSQDCHQGDWWLSDGSAWQFLDVGFNATLATTSAPGIVQLATDLEVQGGLNSDHAVTPSGLQSKVSDSATTESSTTIASSNAVKTAYDLANAALPKSGGTMSGAITFDGSQTFPVAGIQDATTGQKGVVQVGSNINVISGTISVNTGSITQSGVLQLTDSTSSKSTTTAATPNAVKTAYDLAAGALATTGGTMTGTVTFAGAQTFPVSGIQDGTTSQKGVVQLTDSVSSTSITTAATPNAVKTAYDLALSAQSSSPLTSATVLYVNATSGNNATAARGTAKPYATLTAAIAAASEGDTIFIAPGTYSESPTLNKGLNIIGTFVDQAIWSGPKISGTFTVNISGAGTKNWAVSNMQFVASVAGNDGVVVSNNSFGSGGIGSFTNCFFGQLTSSSLTEQAFSTSGTWTRSLYLRNCTFDGNFTHNAGTVAGASGYIVIDNLFGIGASDKYYKVTAGTCEFRNPSNSMAPVLQTGGVCVVENALSWEVNSSATTTIFGGTGFSYKGTSAGLGSCYLYLTGQGSIIDSSGGTWGKLSIGSNVVYSFGNVVYDTSMATLSGVPLTSVAPNPNGVLSTMARPQWTYLTATSTVSAANQTAVVLDGTNGNVYTVPAFDAGTY